MSCAGEALTQPRANFEDDREETRDRPLPREREDAFVETAAVEPLDDFFFAGVCFRAFFGALERLSIGMTVPSGNLAEMTSSPPRASM